MKYVFTLNLKDDPEVIDTYKRHHREVWPEVQASLRQAGVQQMDIYLLGRRLVMVVEMPDGLDYRVAFKSHALSSERVAEWERLMRSLQEPVVDARAGEWWAFMEPVFHLAPGTEVPGSTELPPLSRVQRPRTGPEEPAIAHVADRSRTT